MIVLIIAASIQRNFRFNREFVTSKPTFYAFAGVNAFSMILGLTYIAYLGSHRYLNVAEGFGLRVVPFTVVLCLTICLFLLNFSNILDKHNSTLSLYLGTKLTVLVIVVGMQMQHNTVVSIMLFILAIICIVIGLRLKQKPLRIYALVLSLISVLKLLIFDISFDDKLARALSLLVCGVLCFSISFIYNKIEKSNAIKDNNGE